eukprot:SAG11_NODE_1701_length_4423_cov_2.759713_3_plen_189_part_00
MADVISSCDHGRTCFVRNDSPRPWCGTLVVQVTELATSRVTVLLNRTLALGAGAGELRWLDLPQIQAHSADEYVLETVLEGLHGGAVSHNLVPWTTPEKMMKLRKSNASVAAVRRTGGGFAADVSVQAAAMYVTLTTLASGRFEDNAMLVLPPGREVGFIPTAPPDDAAFALFESSLRVEDLSLYRGA